MKKLFAISTLALAAAVTVNAKTADELRIYINPGHGSWTANDRPCTLVGHGAYSRTNTDSLSFFESNTNLRKGFGVLEALRAYGLKFDPTLNQTGELWEIGAARDLSQNIVMSHVKCGPYLEDNATPSQYDAMIKDILDKINAGTKYEDLTDDEKKRYDDNRFLKNVVAVRYNRNLSDISAEVTANNFDMFISIHSNAATEGTNTNYPLFLYGGYDQIKEGSGHVTAERQTLSKAMAQAAWKYTYENPHMQWTYYSMTNMNIRGDINFYSTTSTNGYLGALKHSAPGFLVEGYFHTYQPARHRAMNWDVDYIEGLAYAHGIADYFGLEKEKTGVIYGIVRDKNEKFKDAAYGPNATTPDAYKPLNGVKVILKKDGAQVAEYTTDNYYNGAFVFGKLEPGKYTLEFAHEQYLNAEPVEVEVKAATVSYPTVSLVNKDWTPPTVFYYNYPNIVVPGTFAADEYKFNQTYVDEPIAELEGKTVRRVIAKDNNLYILAHDADKNATIIVYDAVNKAVLANVSSEGTQGSICGVYDIQVSADGVLVATNGTLNHFNADQVQAGETRGVNRIYRWENDENGIPTGNPVEMGTSMLSGNMYRAIVGTTMAFSGTMKDGKIVLPLYSWYESTSHKFFYNIYTIVDGEIASATFNNKVNPDLEVEACGGEYSINTSPLDDDCFIITSAKGKVGQYGFRDVFNNKVLMPEGIATGSVTAGYFRYNNHSYMVVADNAEGKNVGFKLIDITDGVDNPVVVSTVNTTLPEAEGAMVTGSIVPVKDAEENIKGAYINFFAVRDGKVSRVTTEGVTQPVYKSEFAYGVKAVENTENENYEISYSLTGDAVAANLVFTPKTEGEKIVMPLESTKGEHSVTVAKTDLADDTEYTWAIEVTSKANPAHGEINKIPVKATKRGSLITFTDPEYPTYGYTVVGDNVGTGFDVYDPAGVRVYEGIHKGHSLLGSDSNQSNPIRGAEHMGHALVAAWGDNAHGVTAFNPLDPNEDLYSVFEGEMASNGLISYNGVGIGSGTPCVAIQGKGENARMFTFDEDLLNNHIAVYNIGANRTIKTAPVADWGFCALDNTNVEIQTVENGIFASQVRSDFMDGGSYSLQFIDNEGKRVWKSTDKEDWPADMIKNCSSAIAVNRDGTLLAIGGYSGIRIFDLSFDAENKPVLTDRGGISVPTINWATMRFDAANNLHYYGRGDAYRVFAIGQGKPVISTPGYTVISGTSGVEDITIDSEDNNAPVEYYTISGIRVPSDNLAPGLYIKRQGKKVEKVIIK